MAAEPVRWQVRVRFHECTPRQVLSATEYVAYADMAVFEFWRAAVGGYDALLATGVDSVVAATKARYLTPARYDDVLDIEGIVSHVGTTSFEYTTQIRRETTLLAIVKMVSVFIDPDTRAKREPPDILREALVSHLRPPEEHSAK